MKPLAGSEVKGAKRGFFVYLLRCSDNSFYCGWTNDLEKRVEAHNAGKASRYTRARLPVRLVFSEKAESQSRAMKREAEIKRLPKNRKALLAARGL
ncbi:MAG: GIY-YIG nuclease family protein [Candidatus Diapherotrites archaeon]|nr:GIY-YIG nuclease family protein [Candidatus Diapherotrites archaeon]